MLELRTLGGLELHRVTAEGTENLPLQTKRLALLAYLATAPNHGYRRRDTVLGLFWPDLDQEHARGALRQALHSLRRSLGDSVVLTRGESELGLDASLLHWDGDLLATAATADPASAIALYRGAFLEGVFISDAAIELEQWISTERDRLRALASDAAWRVAGDPVHRTNASRNVRLAVRLSGDDETALRRGIAVLEANGNRAEAIALYAEFAERIARELQVGVSSETQELIQRIRRAVVMVDEPPLPVADEPVRLKRTAPSVAPQHVAHNPMARKLRYLVVGGVAAGLLAIGSTALRRADPAGEQVLAIVPFRVSAVDSSLHWLREGMVELLAIRLTGAGEFRVVDPGRMLDTWHRRESSQRGELTAVAIDEVVAALSATRLIEGSITGDRRHVTLNAWLREASRQEPLSQAAVSGSPDTLPLLVDALAVQLLGRNAGVLESQLASVGTSSLPAVRAFIRGREAAQRGRIEVAIRHYSEALDIDSTFAVAALELIRAANWVDDGVHLGRARRLAVAYRHRLGPGDRAMLDARNIPWGTATELFSKWQAVVDAFPDRAEAWYGYGDVHFHWGPLAGEEGSLERAAEAFRRGWALDSAAAGRFALTRPPLAEPMIHLIEIAQLRGDSAEVLHLTALVLAADSTSELAAVARWHRAQIGGREAQATFWRTERTPGVEWARDIVAFSVWTGKGADDVRQARAHITRGQPAATPPFVDMGQMLAALNAGRPSEVPPGSEVRNYTARQALRNRVSHALSWEGDTAAALAALSHIAQFADAAPDTGEAGAAQLRDVCTVGQWRAAHGDHAGAAAASARLRTTPVPEGLSAVRGFARFMNLCAAMLDATRAVGMRLPGATSAVAAADSLARDFIFEVCCRDAVDGANLHLARLWERQDSLSRALQAARRRSGGFRVGPLFLSSYLREEGRLAALVGDTAGAVRAYRHYLALRPDPEPRLRQAVDQVRRALEELKRGAP